MVEEIKDGQEVHETPENEDANSQDAVEETTENEETLTPQEIADLKKKAEASSQNFERLKKAEEELKRLKAQPSSTQDKETPELSNKDVIYLAKADIHEEDVDDVIEMAKLRNVSISEAHKFMQPILRERAEERKTASVTQTKGGQRGASKDKGEDMLRKAELTGEVPSDAAGMKALAEARIARLKAKR